LEVGGSSRGLRGRVDFFLRRSGTLALASIAVIGGGFLGWDYFMDQNPWGDSGVYYSISVTTETAGEYLLLVPLALDDSGEPFRFDGLDSEFSSGEASYCHYDTQYGPAMFVTAVGDFRLTWRWHEPNPTSPTEATLSLTDREYPRNATSFVYSSTEGLDISVHLSWYMASRTPGDALYENTYFFHIVSSIDGWNEVHPYT